MSRLLKSSELPPAVCHNPAGKSPLFIICEHASNRIPESLIRLGLGSHDLNRHIAWDIGAFPVAGRLAEKMDAVLIYQNYSRLVVDCNRNLDNATLIPEISDGTRIPGNQNLSVTERSNRIEQIWRPFQSTIEDRLNQRKRTGRPTAIVTVHSFTPILNGRARPWQIGLLFGRDKRLASALQKKLSDLDASLVIGMNQPYRILDEEDQTLPVFGEKRGLRHVAVEIRQDLIGDETGQKIWADLLASACQATIAQISKSNYKE